MNVWGDRWGASWADAWAQAAEVVVSPEAPLDEYAAKGWAPRTFYTPYWMGMVPADEIAKTAAERVRQARIEYGITPREVEEVIAPLAQQQADEPGDEIDEFIALNEAITQRGLEWKDHFGGHLAALREELKDVAASRERAAALKAKKADEREKLEASARQELQRRETLRARHEAEQRRRRAIALALLASVT